jgi:hypothetical protein
VARAARPRGRGRPGCPPRRGGWMGDAGGGAPEARPGPAAAAGSRSARGPSGPFQLPPRSSSRAGPPQAPGAPPRDGEAGRCGMPRSGGGCRPPGTPSPRGGGRGRAGTAPQGAAGNRWRTANGPRRPSDPGGGSPRAFGTPTAEGSPGHAPRWDDVGGGQRPEGRGSCHLDRSQRRGAARRAPLQLGPMVGDQSSTVLSKCPRAQGAPGGETNGRQVAPRRDRADHLVKGCQPLHLSPGQRPRDPAPQGSPRGGKARQGTPRIARGRAGPKGTPDGALAPRRGAGARRGPRAPPGEGRTEGRSPRAAIARTT